MRQSSVGTVAMSSPETFETGDAGSTEITVDGVLELLDGASLFSATRSFGNAGSIVVSAGELRIDGEGATSEYLMRKIRNMIQCAFHGRLYDFLKDDEFERACLPGDLSPEPPEIA